MGVGGNNGVEEGIDGGKGGCVGAYVVLYVYLVSAYSPSYSPLSQSVYFVPLLLHYSLRMEHLDQNKENFEYKVKLKSG